MTAQSVQHSRLDPEDILRRLPSAERERFIDEYRAAVEAARDLSRYRRLEHVLRLWHMRAVAYAGDDFARRAQAAREGDESEFSSAG